MKIGKILAIGVGSLLLLGVTAVTVMAIKPPAMRPAVSGSFAVTPERLERGRYLTHHVSDCLGCHSDHVADRWGFPIRRETLGRGGLPFDAGAGVPGLVCAQNITPDKETGLGAWTDGEIARAIREGVNREGHALFPMMPYPFFRNLSDDDVQAIVVYLRTLKPIRHETPKRKLDFPVNLIVKTIPKPVEGPVTTPDPDQNPLDYGKYLVTAAGCMECHTPHDNRGQMIAGKEFSGGWAMTGIWGTVVTANITPHPDTYMGKVSRDAFIKRFKAYQSLNEETSPVATPGKNTIMPWLAFSGMTERDLGLIYDYLKTIAPIKNEVNPFPDLAQKPGQS